MKKIYFFSILLISVLTSCATEPDIEQKDFSGAAVSWIDDDFVIQDIYVYKNEIYISAHDWCIEHNIRPDFAYIPKVTADQVDTTKRCKYMEAWKSEGFGYLIHPNHTPWYTDPNCNYLRDTAKMRTCLEDCIQYFENHGMINQYKIFVYPGNSGNDAEARNIVCQYVDFAIKNTYAKTNHGPIDDPYQIQRFGIRLSDSMTKSMHKELIAKYLSDGDWVILYSHLWEWENDMRTDETSMTLGNLLEIVQYADSLCPIRSTEYVLSHRK